ncbi:MAG: hypothetical protein C4537_02555 [Acholeplasma sp.]|jgi:predicted heme/steroid binding protein|nr:MAG: hypothetical protein C4537_02555 [Acholeplasma sp.]
MKHFLWLLMLVFVFGLSACTTDETYEETPIPTNDGEELIELTLEELSYYDGKDGKPAYIAVQGYIYDVTDSSFWTNGGHNGYSAGQDLTDEIINSSPHGIENMSRVPKIGILVTGE